MWVSNRKSGSERRRLCDSSSDDVYIACFFAVERLLDETDLRVFVYTGQLDLIVDTPGKRAASSFGFSTLS